MQAMQIFLYDFSIPFLRTSLLDEWSKSLLGTGKALNVFLMGSRKRYAGLGKRIVRQIEVEPLKKRSIARAMYYTSCIWNASCLIS